MTYHAKTKSNTYLACCRTWVAQAVFEPSDNVSETFFRYLVHSHELGHGGFHGQHHWWRVLVNGRLVASVTGANLKVVELFEVIHDSRRENEHHGRNCLTQPEFSSWMHLTSSPWL